MKTYGYCRISTAKQNIDRQERNIKSLYPDAIIIKEAFTGTKLEGRKEFEKLLKVIKKGDTIIFDSVSRMSRNAAEGAELYRKLFNDGITLVFLKEPYCNTETYKNALNRQINVNLNSGNAATDKFINSIIDSLNTYTMELATQQIILAFEQSEKEVSDLHTRTREGIETARRNGKRIGRQEGETVETKKAQAAKAIIVKHNKDFGGTLSDSETMTLANISRNSYYKYKKELKDSPAN